MKSIVDRFSIEEADKVARAFATYFTLVNVAEEHHRVRVLRERERSHYPAPVPESVAAAINALWEKGLDEITVQRLLDELDVQFVFTAHPTEAKRRSVLSKVRRISEQLLRREHGDLLKSAEFMLNEGGGHVALVDPAHADHQTGSDRRSANRAPLSSGDHI